MGDVDAGEFHNAVQFPPGTAEEVFALPFVTARPFGVSISDHASFGIRTT